MQTTEGFRGLRCLSCEEQFDATVTHRCPDCGGVLDPAYEDEALEGFHKEFFPGAHNNSASGADTGRTDTVSRGLERFAPVLPFAPEKLVTLGEGTRVIECPTLAAEFGVEQVLLADEGTNPTGGGVDRELSLAVTAARESGTEEVALATTGNAGQAAAAYAARAGLDSQSFVPSRSVFANKAMINVHGGEMSVVGGRYPDAVEAFESARTDESWHSVAPFETPYRHEGAKTLAYELVRALETPPDAVVHPTSHGTGLFGLHKGVRELLQTATIDRQPRLYAAQASGCAPIVEAFETDQTEHEPVSHPDTICGPLEVANPAGGHLVLDALAETDGGVVDTADDDILEAAVSLASAGIPTSVTGGAAVSGARTLAQTGAFDSGDVVVLVNPSTANRDADVLRSHLMKQGI